jgi:hypothetical protein
MAHRTDQPPEQHTPAPWSAPPGRILSEPGTVDQCRADYEDGAEVRQTLAAQEARARR